MSANAFKFLNLDSKFFLQETLSEEANPHESIDHTSDKPCTEPSNSTNATPLTLSSTS